jgi:hypothetical protein
MEGRTLVIDKLIEFEMGELDDEQTVQLFQELVDSKLAWQLQGSYGRMAMQLIADGLVVPSERV